MDCSNVIKLGCFGSCEDILLPNDVVLISGSTTILKIKYSFNGALISYEITNDNPVEPILLDKTKLNEDYEYLINVKSIELSEENPIIKNNCFSFTIKPQA